MPDVLGAYRRRRTDSVDVDSSARAWLIKLDDKPPSSETLTEFRAWLERSSVHRRAFEQAAAAWRSMDRLRKILDAEPAARSAAMHRSKHLGSFPPRRPFLGWLVDRRSRAAAAMTAAALLVMGLLIGVPYLLQFSNGRIAPISYATAMGEVRMVTLSDGSILRLNTASRVIVLYGKKARVLQLAAGEAYFEVAPNPHRPFIVYVGRFAVRALGTAFAVHMLDSGVDLTVTKGHVEFASFATAPANVGAVAAGAGSFDQGKVAEARVSLFSGQQATVANDVKRIEQIDAKGIEKKLSWRDGMLIFDDDPLTQVVSEISRYTSTRFVISDPSIDNLKIGGYFKVQDIGAILDTLQENFGIEVRKDDDNAVYLSRGRAAQ